ncbi:MAG: pyruvate kinase [Candidatus Woesearchaeota archaeon]
MAKAIVTMPPYAPFMDEVLRHPAVEGIRLNTVMPVSESLDDVISRMDSRARHYGKDLWIDLKCRQLRVKSFGVPPFTEIELTHSIKVDTPVTAYFSNGKESATVLKVNGNKLIMQDGPKRVIGPGESVNIPDPSLEVEGYFTDTDRRYIEAGLKSGCHNYILSFVEFQEDVDSLRRLDPLANIVAKIESVKGLDYVENSSGCRLMAARGDLYVEVKYPHQIIDAMESIVRKDPGAIVASRIFNSFERSLEPSCADIGDVDNMLRMGYRTVMFGDEICMQRDSVVSGLNLYRLMAERYK